MTLDPILNEAWDKLILGDIEWLKLMPDSLEKNHIMRVLADSLIEEESIDWMFKYFDDYIDEQNAKLDKHNKFLDELEEEE